MDRFAALAALHQAAFAGLGRGWSAAEIAGLAADGDLFEAADGAGFALFRQVADEAELLTLAVAPAARRQGVASALLAEGLAALGDRPVFLEVAADNAAARALYAKFGFAEIGRRPAYYARAEGPKVDALLLARAPSHTTL